MRISASFLGHSERGQYAETDEGVAKKTKVALENGLTPISCVGEMFAEREAGRTMEVVGRLVDAILDAVSAEEANRVVIAYEPLWAIGTGKVATPEQATGGPRLHPPAHRREARQARRGRASCALGRQRQARPDNVKGLMASPDVDGALVGGASLKADSFLRLVFYDKR